MSLSTKTIVILDHTVNMSRKVQQSLNFDCLKTKSSIEAANRPKIEVFQTLWSCATQAVSGKFYCKCVAEIQGVFFK